MTTADPRGFNPNMLELARNRAHLTQTALAAAVDLPQGVISRFENALATPAPDQLDRLAQALGVEVTFFQRPRTEQFWGASVMYRLQRKAKVIDLLQLVAEMQTRAMHLRDMQKSVTVTPRFSIPALAEHTPPGVAAKLTRESWLVRPGPIPNVTALVEAAGVFVIELSSPIAQFDGAVYRAPDLPTVIFVCDGQPGDRRRFTLAHEVGHLVQHGTADLDDNDEANEFAAEFLMPAIDARRAIGLRPDLYRLLDVKRKWGVSVQFLIVRAATLGLITARQKVSMFQRVNALGWRTNEPHPVSPETVTLAPRVVATMREELKYTDEELARALHESEASLRAMYGAHTTPESRHGGLQLL